MLQKFLTAVVAEEWARQYEASASETFVSLVDTTPLAREITTKTLDWLQGKTPPSYHEMALALNRIHAETVSLLQMFATDCKLPMSSIPFLGNEIDVTGAREKAFTIDRANWALDREYTRLKDSLGRTKKKELSVIAEKRSAILASIARYNETKAQHDIRVSAAFAAAFVAFKSTPDKVSPVVKGIMNGIKVLRCLCYLDLLPHWFPSRLKKTKIYRSDQHSQWLLSFDSASKINSVNPQIRSSRIFAPFFARMQNKHPHSLACVNPSMEFYHSR